MLASFSRKWISVGYIFELKRPMNPPHCQTTIFSDTLPSYAISLSSNGTNIVFRIPNLEFSLFYLLLIPSDSVLYHSPGLLKTFLCLDSPSLQYIFQNMTGKQLLPSIHFVWFPTDKRRSESKHFWVQNSPISNHEASIQSIHPELSSHILSRALGFSWCYSSTCSLLFLHSSPMKDLLIILDPAIQPVQMSTLYKTSPHFPKRGITYHLLCTHSTLLALPLALLSFCITLEWFVYKAISPSSWRRATSDSFLLAPLNTCHLALVTYTLNGM